MRMRTRLAALMVAAPLALTGCGGSSSPSPSGTATAAASSAAPAGIPVVSAGQEVDKAAFIKGMSEAQTNAKTFAMDMDIDVTAAGTPQKMKLVGAVDSSNPASPKMKATITMPVLPEPMEMVMVDQNIYMKMSMLGNKYIKMSLADLAKTSGQDLTQLMDPSKQLERQMSAITKVVYVGDEDVSGVKTRHYTATMDGEAAVKLSGQSLPSSATLGKAIPMNLWLDEQNRPKKMAMDMTIGDKDSMKMVGTMSKYGEPVTVTAPPASEVTTMPNMPAPSKTS